MPLPAAIPGFLSTPGGAALIGQAGNIASAFLSGGDKTSKRATREQITDSLQATVRTARAEGLHPLFAMGSNIAIPPQQQAGESPAGRAVRSAAKAVSDYPLMQAQIEESRSRANLNDAERIRIESRIAEEANAEGVNNDGAVVHAYGTKPGTPLTVSPVEVNPRFAPVKDPYTGRVTKQTGEKVQKDITEVFGPYVDDWIHNPGERARIEKELGDAFKAAPGVRNYIRWRSRTDRRVRELFDRIKTKGQKAADRKAANIAARARNRRRRMNQPWRRYEKR